MNDIPEDKLQKWIEERNKSTVYHRKNVSSYKFPWCIADVPNERWAKCVFPTAENAYEKLCLYILKMCMVDTNNPIKVWNEYITKNNYYKSALNALEIKKLHYTNSLGTNLYLEIPEGNRWLNIDKTDMYGNQMIANMPCYELFNTPNCKKTSGVVYASKPLYYNDTLIDNLKLEFKEGKIINCEATQGLKTIEEIISNIKNACYLGEVALVPIDSPIAKTGIVFNNTLFDENASCHLAIGDGLKSPFANCKELSVEELADKGLNESDVHIDFMIGTPDMNIEAETNKGKVLIFKNGRFNI